MADEHALVITNMDVRSLAAKLQGLHALLSPGEQRLLIELLARAARRTRPAEVAGYDWAVNFNPFDYLDALTRDLDGA